MTKSSPMIGSMAAPVSLDELVDRINRLRFPVWATSVRPFGTNKEAIGSANGPVMCAGVNVSRGEVIGADCDRVVVVPYQQVGSLADAASARTERETDIRLAAEGGIIPERVAGHLNGIEFDTGSE